MKRYWVATLFVGSLVMLAVLGPGTGNVVAADGKAVFDAAKCSTCHAVESLGIEAKTKSASMQGGDLSKVEADPDALAKYLRKEGQLDGKDHKKAIKLEDADMTALIEWLRSDKS